MSEEHDVRLLLAGSSARRGAPGWTDRPRIQGVVGAVLPDMTVDGASPAGGADDVAYDVAVAHFEGRGLSPMRAQRCPVEAAKDGPWPRAGVQRNKRMYRSHRPNLAAVFISGRSGEAWSAGSAHMAATCSRGLPGVPPCAVVVYRENGVEELRDLEGVRLHLGALWRVRPFRDDVLKVGRACSDAIRAQNDESLLALASAIESLREAQPRLAPWLLPLRRFSVPR